MVLRGSTYTAEALQIGCTLAFAPDALSNGNRLCRKYRLLCVGPPLCLRFLQTHCKVLCCHAARQGKKTVSCVFCTHKSWLFFPVATNAPNRKQTDLRTVVLSLAYIRESTTSGSPDRRASGAKPHHRPPRFNLSLGCSFDNSQQRRGDVDGLGERGCRHHPIRVRHRGPGDHSAQPRSADASPQAEGAHSLHTLAVLTIRVLATCAQ